jgi:hypothetical protein
MVLATAVLLAHSWYSPECCGEKDCRPVPCEQLVFHDGFVWYDTDRLPPERVQDSPDGQCHICFSPFRVWPNRLICVFAPKGTS